MRKTHPNHRRRCRRILSVRGQPHTSPLPNRCPHQTLTTLWRHRQSNTESHRTVATCMLPLRGSRTPWHLEFLDTFYRSLQMVSASTGCGQYSRNNLNFEVGKDLSRQDTSTAKDTSRAELPVHHCSVRRYHRRTLSQKLFPGIGTIPLSSRSNTAFCRTSFMLMLNRNGDIYCRESTKNG